MNKKEQELVWQYAELIHENLRYYTDCFNADGTLKTVKYIACIDDDPKSALYAAWLYHKAVSEEQNPTVLCIGGVGLLSKHLKKKGVERYTEGMRLAEVVIKLGVPTDNIIILDQGTNSGENVRDVAEQMLKKFGEIVFSVTKRLSLRWERTFKKQITEQMAKVVTEKYHQGYKTAQIDEPNSYYYVIDETLAEACLWMNGKRSCNNEMMFHELASIYDRSIKYSGTFQLPLHIHVSKRVMKAADYLADRFRIKNGHRGPRELWQYFLLRRDLLKHLPEMQRETDEAIGNMIEKIRKDFHV